MMEKQVGIGYSKVYRTSWSSVSQNKETVSPKIMSFNLPFSLSSYTVLLRQSVLLSRSRISTYKVNLRCEAHLLCQRGTC